MIHLTGVIASAVLLTGCYALQPARGIAPEVGTRVAFDVNDVGRVALGGSMGPEIQQIEGRLVSRDSGNYVLAVSEIHLLNGGNQVWNGEQVHLKSEYISSAYDRKFSPERTVALAAVGIGGFVWIVTRSLAASGTEDPTAGGPQNASRRLPFRR
jgi:hypothetical protein